MKLTNVFLKKTLKLNLDDAQNKKMKRNQYKKFFENQFALYNIIVDLVIIYIKIS